MFYKGLACSQAPNPLSEDRAPDEEGPQGLNRALIKAIIEKQNTERVAALCEKMKDRGIMFDSNQFTGVFFPEGCLGRDSFDEPYKLEATQRIADFMQSNTIYWDLMKIVSLQEATHITLGNSYTQSFKNFLARVKDRQIIMGPRTVVAVLDSLIKVDH